MRVRATLLLVVTVLVGLLLPGWTRAASAEDQPSTAVLRGTVSDSDGTTSAPAERVGVRLYRYDGDTQAFTLKTTTSTGPDGGYTFAGLAEGDYALKFYDDACRHVDVWYGDAAPATTGDAGVVHLEDAADRTVDVTVPKELCPVDDSTPWLSGTTRAGYVVTAYPGIWNAAGATYTYQWMKLSGGVARPIPGAFGQAYTLAGSDVGAEVWAEVTAHAPGYADSEQSPTDSHDVGKGSSTTAGKLARASVRATARGRLAVWVRTPAVLRPAGRVTVRVDGRSRVATALRTTQAGRVTLTLPRLKRGRHHVLATYAGSGAVDGSTSRAVTLTVVR